jgi:proteasome accessory factor A
MIDRGADPKTAPDSSMIATCSSGGPTLFTQRSLAPPRSLDGMTVRRVMGTETEYGIIVPGNPGANAMLISSQIVNAYAQPSSARNRRPRWDFEEESPLRDARGFDLARDVADPSQLTDEDVGLANVILTNGARFYVDHAHPEYSAPEVTNPRDAVIWDKAGERIMAEAARRALQIPGTQPINLYKNNTDNKGASYGTHENYLMRRETPFADIVRHLTPFFVSRQVVCGSGRVGIGQDGRNDGFQVSQRADYFEVEVGLETTLKRPIINTRDEPHAVAEKYRRLHVIIGDANLAEVSTYLKLGTTALVLEMIEDAFLSVDLVVDRPVATLHAVSHDPSLHELITLRSGRKLTAVHLQMEYAEQARKFVEDRYGSDVDAVTADVLDRWESVLTRLETDPMSLTRSTGWPSWRSSRAIGPATGSTGRRRGCRRSTCSTATCVPTRDCSTSCRRPAALIASSPTRRSSTRSCRHRRTHAPTSAVGASRSIPKKSRPPRGTRSSSTCPAASRCSACRPWSRCGGRRSTSATCSSAVRAPKSSSASSLAADARRPI